MTKQSDPDGSEEPDPFSIERASQSQYLPSDEDFYRWLHAALSNETRPTPLHEALSWVNVRLVDEAESRALNAQWRQKDHPTNVLSFPAKVSGFLGDLVLCAPVIEQEAKAQGKALGDHWAHLVIHGVLHLCGWDHQTEFEAEKMEAQEVLILEQLGIINPYLEQRGTETT